VSKAKLLKAALVLLALATPASKAGTMAGAGTSPALGSTMAVATVSPAATPASTAATSPALDTAV